MDRRMGFLHIGVLGTLCAGRLEQVIQDRLVNICWRKIVDITNNNRFVLLVTLAYYRAVQLAVICLPHDEEELFQSRRRIAKECVVCSKVVVVIILDSCSNDACNLNTVV
jgi:hypothetical protein